MHFRSLRSRPAGERTEFEGPPCFEGEKGTHEGKGQENGRTEMTKRGKKIPPRPRNRFVITALDEGVVKVSRMRRGTAHVACPLASFPVD